MAFTFSRRDFMKYTALAAMAVAVSGSLTGCSNPNQPSGVYTGSSDVKLSFGGSSNFFGIGGASDYHILTAGATHSDDELVFNFVHYAVAESSSCSENYYQLDIIDADGKAQGYHNGSKCGDNTVVFTTEGGGNMKVQTEYKNKLTITGISDLDIANAKSVSIRYFPRYTALNRPNDSYGDVYATWILTDWINK